MSSFSSHSSSLPSLPSLGSSLSYLHHNQGTDSHVSSPLLTDADHAFLQRQLDDVRASLSSLPSSQHSAHLLSRLLSAYEGQLIKEREAEQWKQRCGSMRQQLKGVRAQIDNLLHDDETEGPLGAAQPHYANGNEEKEKQSNGHLQHHHQQQPHRQQHSSALTATTAPPQPPPDTAVEFAFNGFGDYATLLAATEAKLEVERKQQQLSLPASTASHSLALPAMAAASSPYYHHDRTLTELGKQLIRSILTLSSPTRILDLTQLQRLCERVGRAAAAAGAGVGADDDGDVWWVWQSYASEGEDGEQGMGQAEMEQLYEHEWNLDEDAQHLGLT